MTTPWVTSGRWAADDKPLEQACHGPQPGRAPMPDHVYIPGKTARHLEGAFDAIRDTATAGLSAADLSQSQAFRTGLAYLEAGFFWEAHEVLEPVWMLLEDGSNEKSLVQALIQYANARLKMLMGRPKAAYRLGDICQDLTAQIRQPVVMTVDLRKLNGDIDSLKAQAKDNL